MKCPRCLGEKKLRKLNIMDARQEWFDCPDCNGTGLKLSSPDSSQVYVNEIPGIYTVFSWVETVNGKKRTRAWIKTIITPVKPVDDNKNNIYRTIIRMVSEYMRSKGILKGAPNLMGFIDWVQTKMDPPKNSVIKPYFVVFILDMETKKKYRGKGYMDNILNRLKEFMSGTVKFMLTDYRESSTEGRAYLMKRGFVHNKPNGQLIWRRDAGQPGKPDEEKPQGDSGSGDVQPGETKPGLGRSGKSV